MEEYFKTLYASDPLFRALVNSRIRELDESVDDFLSNGFLTSDDEIEILREYAITLYKEHKSLKNLFMENLRMSGKTIGLNDGQSSSDNR